MTAKGGRINHVDGTRPIYTTQGGQTIRGVKVGWASYTKLNDARNSVNSAS